MRMFILFATLVYMNHIGIMIFNNGWTDMVLLILCILVCVTQDINEIVGKK